VLRAVALDALMELRGAERARVTTLLERLGYVDEAMAALRARRRSARRSAAELLALAGSDAAVPALTTSLADRNPIVRGTCARALAEIGDEDGVAAILDVVERDAVTAPGAAAATVLTLGARRPSAVGELLGPDVEPKLRAVAAAVAGELRLAEHMPLLRTCLGAAEDEVAARAARGLGLIGDADAVPQLVELLGEEDRTPFVRTAAATALGAIGDAAAVPALERELQSHHWGLRASAADALTLLGDSGSAALRRAARSARDDVRAQVRAVLEP
jgi:HEAT repeat protein